MQEDGALNMKSCEAFVQDKWKEWSTIKEQYDTYKVLAFFNGIVDYASSLENEKSVEDCLAFFDTCIKEINYKPEIVDGLYGLTSLGLDAYIKKQFSIAELAFRILSDCGNSNGRNNYAYMIRRGEITNKTDDSLMKAVRLLRDGIGENEPFAFVNMALLLSLRFTTDADWHLADDLMKEMPDTSVFSIQRWWADVANDDDIEGFLVHYFLLRHKKMYKSELGDKEQLSKRLSEEIKGFPEWLIVQPRFKSLDDVFNAMLEEDFDDGLIKYLNNMPRTREAAEEILEEMTQWDEWDLYKTLLQDYIEFLTPEEIRKTIRAYKKKFIMPLSSVLDESVIKDLDQDGSEEQHDE